MISKDKSLLRVFGSLYAQKNVLLAALHYCSLGKQQSSLLYDSLLLFFFFPIILKHFGARILKLNLLIVQAGCPDLFYQMPQKQREQSIFPDRSQQFVRGLR